MTEPRIAGHPINQAFLDRWSPRSFTGETMPEATLMTMFRRWVLSKHFFF